VIHDLPPSLAACEAAGIIMFRRPAGARNHAPLLDLPNWSLNTGQVKDEPPESPPLVAIDRRESYTALLLAWELHEVSGEWHAWIMTVRERRGESYRHVVAVPASGVRAVEPAEAYREVPRRVRGRDGTIRAWPGTSAS
jgi:hypothetical protein